MYKIKWESTKLSFNKFQNKEMKSKDEIIKDKFNFSTNLKFVIGGLLCLVVFILKHSK